MDDGLINKDNISKEMGEQAKKAIEEVMDTKNTFVHFFKIGLALKSGRSNDEVFDNVIVPILKNLNEIALTDKDGRLVFKKFMIFMNDIKILKIPSFPETQQHLEEIQKALDGRIENKDVNKVSLEYLDGMEASIKWMLEGMNHILDRTTKYFDKESEVTIEQVHADIKKIKRFSESMIENFERKLEEYYGKDGSDKTEVGFN